MGRTAMLKEYNDYICATKRYLKNYVQFKTLVENMRDEAAAIEKDLGMALDVAAPISRYGDEPRGGTPELNAVESAAARRIQKGEYVEELLRNIAEIETLLRRVDRAMDGLSEEDRGIIEDYYLRRKKWEQIGEKRNYSAKRARDIVAIVGL